jgi:hypothetical protein
MKRLLCCLLFSSAVQATVVTGKVVDLTGQPMTSNRSVVFTLQNCGNNQPRVVGSAIIVPSTKTVLPTPAGMLTGTIIGNDAIECGTTIGQTYYKVQIFNGTQEAFSANYVISGPVWNILLANPLSSDPTAFMNLGGGYQLGDQLYGSGANTLGVVRGNTDTTMKVWTQTGAGNGVSGQPRWSTPGEVFASVQVPVSSLTTCSSLTISSDGNYIYVCGSSGSKRLQLAGWW